MLGSYLKCTLAYNTNAIVYKCPVVIELSTIAQSSYENLVCTTKKTLTSNVYYRSYMVHQRNVIHLHMYIQVPDGATSSDDVMNSKGLSLHYIAITNVSSILYTSLKR